MTEKTSGSSARKSRAKASAAAVRGGSPEFPLIPGERIVFSGADARPEATDDELNARYLKGETRIVTESARYSLAGVPAMLKETVTTDEGIVELRYKLDPEYQRRHRWSVQRKSRLIESFLMNVPVPPIFLYEREFARFEVMDGRQRLTALGDFFSDEFALNGLQYWPELNGRRYSNLPGKVRDGIDRRYLSSIILLKETASTEDKEAELKKMVFERLNSGGVALSSHETRNAVYNGPLNRLCIRLSDNPTFRLMWKIPNEQTVPDEIDEEPEEKDESRRGREMFEKMEDVELVLRFFAYRQSTVFPGGLNKITALLDRFLVLGNRFSAEVLTEYEALFVDTIALLAGLLGQDAFCRVRANGKSYGKATKIVFDPLMYVASQYARDQNRSKLLIANRDVVKRHLAEMYEASGELFAGRKTNASEVQKRNTEMSRAFRAAWNEITA